MENALTDTKDLYHLVRVQKAKTPDYRGKLERGEYIKPLPYSLTISDSAKSVFREKLTQVGHGAYGNSVSYTNYNARPIRGDYSVYGDVTNSAYLACRGNLESKFTALANSRTNKLLTKIQAQSLPLIMMYRERHETGKLITRFLDDALFAAKNIKHPDRILARYGFGRGRSRRGSRRITKRFLTRLKRAPGCKSIGDAWLQYRFAWTPLIHDIVDSLNAAATQEKKLHTYHRTVGLPFEFANSNIGGASGSMHGFYRVGCDYVFTDSALAAAGSLMNPAAGAWDSVPYSFIFDWIADVSQYLGLQTATAGATFSSGYESILKDVSIKLDMQKDHTDLFGSLPTNYAWITYAYSGDMPQRHDVEFRRNVLTSFPKPKLEFPLAASLTHGIDVLALSVQKLMKKRF